MWKWLKRLSRSRSQKLTRIEDIFGAVLQGIPLSKFTDYESFLAAGSQLIWACWKACSIVGNVIGETPFKLVRKDSGEEVENQEISQLMSVPNPQWVWREMLYQWSFHIKLTGNAYWLKDEANAAGDRPKALFALNPKRMRIVVDSKKGLTGYLYEAAGKQFPFTPEEIIHFRKPHPDQEFYGLGDIEAGQGLFNEFINRQTYAENFWKHGASPTGILTTTKEYADPEEFKEAKQRFTTEYGGVRNSSKVMWLTGEWDYKKIGLTPSEMESIESSKLTVENIFHMHGVPLSVAGFEEAANFATARVSDLQFRRYTIKPEVETLVETLQSDLIEGFDPNIKLVPTISGLVDSEAVTQFLLPCFDRGMFTIDEIREALGYAKTGDPLHQQYFINAGLQPLELAGIADQGQVDQQSQQIVDRFVAQTLLNRRNGDADVAKAVEQVGERTARMVSDVANKIDNMKPAAAPVISVIPKIDLPPMTLNVDAREPQKRRTKKVKFIRNGDGATVGAEIEED